MHGLPVTLSEATCRRQHSTLPHWPCAMNPHLPRLLCRCHDPRRRKTLAIRRWPWCTRAFALRRRCSLLRDLCPGSVRGSAPDAAAGLRAPAAPAGCRRRRRRRGQRRRCGRRAGRCRGRSVLGVGARRRRAAAGARDHHEGAGNCGGRRLGARTHRRRGRRQARAVGARCHGVAVPDALSQRRALGPPGTRCGGRRLLGCRAGMYRGGAGGPAPRAARPGAGRG
jgi:hypothetical protein